MIQRRYVVLELYRNTKTRVNGKVVETWAKVSDIEGLIVSRRSTQGLMDNSYKVIRTYVLHTSATTITENDRIKSGDDYYEVTSTVKPVDNRIIGDAMIADLKRVDK